MKKPILLYPTCTLLSLFLQIYLLSWQVYNWIQVKGCRIPIIIAVANVVNGQQSSQSYQLMNVVLITNEIISRSK